MKIYSNLGEKIADIPIQEDAVHERELMKSDFIRLEWSQSSLLELPCGSYVEYDGVKYRLLKNYKPEQQSTQQWDYSPEFQHPVMMLGTIPFIHVTGDTTSWQSADKETEWNWTGMAINLVQEAFVPFLNKYGADNTDIGTGWTAVVDSDLKASETCSFQSMDFLSALSHAAQQFECEWHLDYENKILYFGHINITTSELVFEVGNNIDKPTIRENNEGYYNAYIAKGSTRNISQVNDKGENIQVNKRLKLNPEKYPDGYIDRRKTNREPLVVKELIYDDIYPSLDLYIYNPRARTRYLLDSNGERIEDEKDPTGYKRYSIWYVRLAYQINGEWKDFDFSKDMLIGNLSCQFQGNETSTKYTSPLAGLEFELKYHESDYVIPADPVTEDTGIEIKKGDYEIVYNENNGLIIPTTVEGGMCPLGDTEPSEQNNILRLYNIALPSEYISDAQEELEKQALKDIAYWESDRNNYEFNSNPIAFKLDMPRLFIGRGVKYKNGNYELNTRISKLVQKIDFPFEVEITVGNEEIKGTTTTMREQLQMVVSAMNNGMGGMNVEQFKKMLNIYAPHMFDGRYLSKTSNDTAAGLISFLKGLVSEGVISAKQGVEIGEFVTGLYTGTGAAIDEKGNAEVESLRVRSYLEVMELIINRLSAIEGDQILTEADTIETVDDLGDGLYRLKLKEKWEGYFTAQVVGNVVKGIINTLASGSGVYYTSWMLVKDVDTATNQIVVQTYPDEDTPAGRNFPPCELMKIARWGNVADEKRQSCLYFSSSDNRILRLSRVTKPIIGIGNYGFILGELPEWFYDPEQKLPINKEGDAIYVKTLVYQNAVKMNYQGKPEATIVDRGNWMENPEEPYHFEAINAQTGVYETSDVWYRGCKWRCIKDCPTGAPRYDSMEWFMIEGNPDFTISIEVENGGMLDYDWFAAHGTDLVVTGQIHNQDVTADILDTDVSWTRRSKDAEGNWRVSDDEAWNALLRKGKTLHLTVDDISYNSSGLPQMLEFTATVILRDGVTAEDTITVI